MRSGAGLVLGLTIWIMAIALVYALILAQASGGATTSLARVAHQRTMLFAGRSALDESCFALRNHAAGYSPVLREILHGSNAGTAHDPALSRDSYRPLVEGGRLEMRPVAYTVVSRPASKETTEPWLIDLSVELSMGTGLGVGTTLQRIVRRRYVAVVHRVIQTVGRPDARGKVIYSQLRLHQDGILEVSEP